EAAGGYTYLSSVRNGLFELYGVRDYEECRALTLHRVCRSTGRLLSGIRRPFFTYVVCDLARLGYLTPSSFREALSQQRLTVQLGNSGFCDEEYFAYLLHR